MADIYGQLVKAQLENSASDLSNVAGLVYYKTDTGVVKFYDAVGAAWRVLVSEAATQTLTGKTLTSPTIQTPTLDDYVDFNEEVAPGSPTAGHVRVYAKTDKKLYMKDSNGTETALAGGGLGEINVVENPNDAAAGWAASGAGVTVATSTTTSDLPLGPTIDTCIKITPVSSTDYARYRWTMPTALKSKKLKVEWHQHPISGYAGGDFKVEVYKNSASDYSGSYTEFALSTDSSGTSSIPNADGKYTTTFDADTADYYELRIVRTAGTTALCIAAVVIGPGIQPQGAVVSDWVSFTPTITATGGGSVSIGSAGNAAALGRWRRVGTSMDVQFTWRFGTSSPAFGSSGNYKFNLPTGYTIDTTALAQQSGADVAIGSGSFYDSDLIDFYPLTVIYNNAAGGILAEVENSASGQVIGTTAPVTLAASDMISITFSIPISEWSGAGTLSMIQDDSLKEWQAYTPTITASSSNPTLPSSYTLTAFWRRVGSDMEIIFDYANSNNAGAASGSGNYQVSLPSGYTIDTGVVTVGTAHTHLPLGKAFLTDLNTNVDAVGTAFPYTTTTLGFTYLPEGTANGALWSSTSSFPIANVSGIRVGFTAKVPILEWKNRSSGGPVGFAMADTNGNAGLVSPYNPGAGVVYAGTYTPTFSLANASGGTARQHNYMRVGNIVYVSGTVDGLTVTTTGVDVTLTLTSLPVATANFADAYQASGVGYLGRNTGGIKDAMGVSATAGAQTIAIATDNTTAATGGTSVVINYSFSYKIQ